MFCVKRPASGRKQSASKFVKTHAFWVDPLGAFNDFRRPTEKKPILRFGLPKFQEVAPKRPIPNVWRGPKSSELAGDPVVLNSRFDLMTTNVIPFDRPKIVTGFSDIRGFVSCLRFVRTSTKVCTELFAIFRLVPH